MTHLHLRRASSLQTASYTFSLVRLSPKTLNARRRSDAKQTGGRVANPAASPQPVVGIHFEVIIGERLIVIPPLLAFQIPSVSRISIQAARHTHTHTHTLTRAHTHRGERGGTMSPDLAKFTQLWLQELGSTGRASGSVWRESSGSPPQFGLLLLLLGPRMLMMLAVNSSRSKFPP